MLYYSYIVFGLGTLIKLFFCLKSWLRPGKFYSAKIWFTLFFLEDIGNWLFLILSNSNSISYATFYFWSDLTIAVTGLVLLVRLAEISFGKARTIAPVLRGSAMAIISGIAVISGVEVYKHLQTAPKTFHLLIAFAINMEQNTAAAGMLASVMLWLAMTLLLVPGVQIRRIVAGMAIFYSCTAIPVSAISLFGFSMAYLVPWFAMAALIFLGMAISKTDDLQPAMRRRPARGTEIQARPQVTAATVNMMARNGLAPRYALAGSYREGR